MNPSTSFICLEGRLDESMQFALVHGYESRTRRQAPAHQPETGMVIELLDEGGQVLVSKDCDLRFPQGCSGRPALPALGVLRVEVALHPATRQLRLLGNGRAMFAAPVGTAAPSIALRLEPAIEDGIARFRCESAAARGNVHFAMLDESGRQMPFVPASDGDRYTVDLRRYEGLGTARVQATATHDFRTSIATTDPLTLPAGIVGGRIVEPREHAELPPYTPGNLIANLSYQHSGRALAWNPQQCRWVIDGIAVPDTRQLALFEGLKPGVHTVELWYGKAGEQGSVLDQVQVRVRDETASEREYAAVLERYRAAAEAKAMPVTTAAEQSGGCQPCSGAAAP